MPHRRHRVSNVQISLNSKKPQIDFRCCRLICHIAAFRARLGRDRHRSSQTHFLPLKTVAGRGESFFESNSVLIELDCELRRDCPGGPHQTTPFEALGREFGQVGYGRTPTSHKDLIAFVPCCRKNLLDLALQGDGAIDVVSDVLWIGMRKAGGPNDVLGDAKQLVPIRFGPGKSVADLLTVDVRFGNRAGKRGHSIISNDRS